MSSDNKTPNLFGRSSEEVSQQRITSGESQRPSVSNAAVVPQEYNVQTLVFFESQVSSLAQDAVVSQLSHLGLPSHLLLHNIGASNASSSKTLPGDLLGYVSAAVASASAVTRPSSSSVRSALPSLTNQRDMMNC